MNVVGGSIVWDLSVNDNTFTSDLNKARAAANAAADDIDKSGKKVETSFDKAAGASKAFALGLAAVGVAIGAGVGFGVKMAAEIETARQGFVTLLGSTQAADAAISQIKKDAIATPFNFTDLVKANQQLTSVTKNSQQSEGVLLNVGKALAAAGKGSDSLNNIIANLQQIGNTGKITELDVRQFGNNGINVLELLADYYGTTKEAAGEMVKNSKTAFGDLEGAFKKAGEGSGKFSQAFIQQSGTWNQLMSNFGDVTSQIAAQIVSDSGIFGGLKTALSGIIGELQKFQPQIVAGITNFLSFIVQNGPIVVGILLGGLYPAIIALIPAIWAFGAGAVALLPYILIGAAIGVAVELLYKAWTTNFLGIRDITGQVFLAIQTAVNSVVTWFSTYVLPTLIFVFTWVGSVLTTLGQIFMNIWVFIIKPILRAFIDWVYNTFIAPLIAGFDLITQALNDLGYSWTDVWNGIKNFVFGILKDIVDEVKSKINSVIGIINGLINGANSVGGKVAGYTHINPIPLLAQGVNNFSGGMAIVGERGPELVNLPTGTDVIPHNQSMQMLGGSSTSGGVNVSIGSVIVQDQSDIESIGREIGFRVDMSPLFLANG